MFSEEEKADSLYGMSLEKDGLLQALKNFLNPHKKKAAQSYNELMGDNRGRGKEDSRKVFNKIFYAHSYEFKRKKAKRIGQIYDLFLFEYIMTEDQVDYEIID